MRSNLLRISLVAALAAPALASDYDETIDGDISGDRLNTTVLNLTTGSNVVTATQQGDAFGLDVDYLTIVISPGSQLVRLDCPAYSALGNPNLAFLGLQAGPTFTTPFTNTDAADLLGGIVYGFFSVGFDLLPQVATLGGATGFTPPLGAGTYTWWYNQTGDPSTVTLDFVIESVDGPVGTNYCTANANSTGQTPVISAVGSLTASDNSLTLSADSLPVGTPGLFFYGPNQVQLPFGEGIRCVGGSIQRLQPPTFAPASGVVSRAVDLAAEGIGAGTTVNFQYWFRDLAGGPAGFNLSDGLSVSFL